MKTGELELHTRRVVWRYGKTEEGWRHFGYATVSFGDKPARVYLEIFIRQAADMFQRIDPEAAKKIKNDRYDDDIATGYLQKLRGWQEIAIIKTMSLKLMVR